MRTFLILAATAGLLAACGDKSADTADNTAGPVVSAPEAPVNAAVDTTPTTGETALTPGANSFTEAQARGAITGAGYTDVSALTQNAQGIWQGTGMMNGKSVAVSVDYKGAVTPQAAAAATTPAAN